MAKRKNKKNMRKSANKPRVIKQSEAGKDDKPNDVKNSLEAIADQLKVANKKVQLIYAFNGSGKTRLSREFKKLITTPEIDTEKDGADDEPELARNKFLYYSAFTEDLFYWDNGLEVGAEPKLKIQPNTFTNWLIELLKDLGEDGNIITNFQRYANDKITPSFNEEYKSIINDYSGKEVEVTVPAFSEIIFQVAAKPSALTNSASLDSEDGEAKVEGVYERIKISKGEESNFVWSVFYTLLEQIVSTLNEPDTTNRLTDKFDGLEYVFIDDPVSSLDDSHLIELAVDLAGLIKSSKSDLKYVITTHSPLFYNVLCNELSNKAYEKQPDETYKLSYNPNKEFKKYRLVKQADGLFQILEQPTDSPFSYHLFLLSELQVAIKDSKIRKYHFSFIRNILEKMATFLGYNYWPALLPKTADGKPDPFANRILNLSSHSAHAGEEVADVDDKDKDKLDVLVKYLIKTYGFRKQEAQ
jgi:hypothetical protein